MFSKVLITLFFCSLLLLQLVFSIDPDGGGVRNSIRHAGGEAKAMEEMKDLQLQLRKVNDDPNLSDSEKQTKTTELRTKISETMKTMTSSRRFDFEENIRHRSHDGRKPKPPGPFEGRAGQDHPMLVRIEKQCTDMHERLEKKTGMTPDAVEETKKKIDTFCDLERGLVTDKADAHAKLRDITTQISDPKQRQEAIRAFHEESKNKRDVEGERAAHKRSGEMRREIMDILSGRAQDL